MTKQDCELIMSFKYFARSLCNVKEDAEDIIQDVILKILNNPKTFDSIESESEKGDFIMKAIRNTKISYFRRDTCGKRDKTEYNIPVSTRPNVFGIMDLKFIKNLTKTNKVVNTLLLSTYGYTTSEICCLIKEENKNNVLAQTFRARKFIKSKNL